MSSIPDVKYAPAAANPQTLRRLSAVIVATSLVTGLEIFDFTVYGFFAAMIGDQFFPAANPMTSLLLAVGTFGVGFFVRPLGAAMIGAYADRVGRRAAMTATCWLMALGTAAIGLCPPFATIGLAAPLIVIVARLLQGFAVGGEIGAAASLAMEAAPISHRGWLVSWQLASQGAAALLGACLGLLLTSVMSPAYLASWGWRIPFLIGLLIAPAGVYVRRQLRETSIPTATRTSVRTPLAELCREHGATLIAATLMMSWRTVSFYIIVSYMPSYVTRVMHMPAIIGFRSSALSALLLVVVSPLSGLLADRLPRRKPLVLLTSGATALLVYPLFLIITHAHGALPVLCSVGLISALLALGNGFNTLLVLEALPARVRASGVATSYALGVALFGGTAQFIVTALIEWTGDPISAAWYVALACLVSFCALILFREQRAQT
ncbi:MHS family proline/betaine transporter-like MFS transporter [Trinickia symbiotica]|uniref:MFS transporter n=1 Tax=Trinickia symbiotica TaxID=863227 RepID=A0A2N7WV92_9BURK|nr:MFS transporter [Trinickia symbiotica]PPK42395.1 MHS family proline/betaine transporter-like MFS transporter [Trinickia symbiotica]